jgi:uncharacterized membrane protein YidH (DUF202 family)
MLPWILITIVTALIVFGLAIVFAFKMKEKKQEPDYRTFFILGVTWIPLGIATENYAFCVIGVAFMIIGLLNKDKWKEPVKFSKLKPEQRRYKILVMVSLGLLVLLGLVAFLLYN